MGIEITVKNYRCFPDDSPLRFTLDKGLSAFIGINNAGKSSALRFLYDFRPLFLVLGSANFLASFGPNATSFSHYPPPIVDMNEVFFNGNDRDMHIEFRFAGGEGGEQVQKIGLRIPRGTNTFSTEEITLTGGRKLAREAGPLTRSGNAFRLPDGTEIDIAPVQACFAGLTSTMYIGPFRNAIHIGATQGYFDISIGQAFVAAWSSYKTGHIRANNKAASQLTKDIRRIFGFEELDISATPENQSLVVNIDGETYGLLDVGSGLSHFIIALVSAAIKRPAYILIDEPESNLHPSLQLDFLTTLAFRATKGLLFATHSLGLARSAAERVYSVRKLKSGGSEIHPLEGTPDLAEFLGSVGFSSYQELGFEKVLLVEGPNDVLTIQQFLRKYNKEQRIVLLPLGGSSVINRERAAQLEEIKRITSDVVAIVDSERTEAGGALKEEVAAFQDTCESLGITCHVLERRALENYISDRALKVTFGDAYVAPEHFQRPKDLQLGWSKAETWRAAREMTLDELQGTDLATILSAL